jgi:hypothetical protein
MALKIAIFSKTSKNVIFDENECGNEGSYGIKEDVLTSHWAQ